MISSILKAYGIPEPNVVLPLVSGLINRTWKVTAGESSYILQRVNDQVFNRPIELVENIRRIGDYLQRNSPDYFFVTPLANEQQEFIVVSDGGYYRLFPFVKGSHTINVVASADQAFEAANQFGTFTRLLSGFNADTLHTTIADFHNLGLRHQQFKDAVTRGNPERIRQSKTLIAELKRYVHVVEDYKKIKKNVLVKQRVTHHDTKISNVLFDDSGKGICVIDLDTVMPGYFFSDVGDMMRTYLSPANEEEKDFDKIEIRDEFFSAIMQGYLFKMSDELTETEKGLMLYAGMFMIYMQSIRFLGDYCNDDIYYGSAYEGQNFVRAGNQLDLLKKLEERKSHFGAIISKEIKGRTYTHLK